MKSATVVHGSPGTGKSYHLIEQANTYTDKGARVLMLSHTKVAAAELKARVVTRAEFVDTSTIHSMVYRLMGVDYRQVVTKPRLVSLGAEIGVTISGNFDINSEQERIIEEGDEAMSIISRADAKMVDPLAEFDASNRPLARATFEYVATSYVKWKQAHGYLDFTDMLLLYIRNPAPIQYNIMIVDEAQDLSKAQWEVIKAMSEYVEHVIVAGDPDQQLFSWGGSDTLGMQTYASTNNADVYALPQSYRIPRTVFTVAMDIRNRLREKEVVTYRPRDAEGMVTRYPDATHIEFDSTDTLVLYRTHSLRRELEARLMETRTPYKVLNGLKDPWHSRYGAAVAAFNKAKSGVDVTAKEQTLLDRYCYARTITASMQWQTYMDIPPEYIVYMDATEGMEPTVKLSTIHGAKGMEAERVVLYSGLTQRVVDGMTFDEDAEHKVFYVGVTRSRNKLDIVDGDLSYEV